MNPTILLNIFQRAPIAFAIASVVLLANWFWPPQKWWVPLSGLVASLVMAVSAASFGSAATISLAHFCWPTVRFGLLRWMGGAGLLLFIYLAAIFTQLLENLARLIQGLPAKKIVWFKKQRHFVRARKPMD